MPRSQKIDPEVEARIEMRRAYGLLFTVLAVICVLGAFACVFFEREVWPAVVLFFGCLSAGGFLSTADISAFRGAGKALPGSP